MSSYYAAPIRPEQIRYYMQHYDNDAPAGKEWKNHKYLYKKRSKSGKWVYYYRKKNDDGLTDTRTYASDDRTLTSETRNKKTLFGLGRKTTTYNYKEISPEKSDNNSWFDKVEWKKKKSGNFLNKTTTITETTKPGKLSKWMDKHF